MRRIYYWDSFFYFCYKRRGSYDSSYQYLLWCLWTVVSSRIEYLISQRNLNITMEFIKISHWNLKNFMLKLKRKKIIFFLLKNSNRLVSFSNNNSLIYHFVFKNIVESRSENWRRRREWSSIFRINLRNI